jgi:hypothetical protein
MVKYQGKTIANWQSLKSNRHISKMEKHFEQVFLGPKLGYDMSIKRFHLLNISPWNYNKE